jgi:hypothetical protein
METISVKACGSTQLLAVFSELRRCGGHRRHHLGDSSKDGRNVPKPTVCGGRDGPGPGLAPEATPPAHLAHLKNPPDALAARPQRVVFRAPVWRALGVGMPRDHLWALEPIRQAAQKQVRVSSAVFFWRSVFG